MKKIIYFFSVLCTFICAQPPSAFAQIIEIQNIEDITTHVEQDTLVLFNIAEVLTDSSISLGSSPWRKYIKTQAAKWETPPHFNVHDTLTWLIANRVPHRAVESTTSALVKRLQLQGNPVAALTSRGRSEWYSTEINGVDDITEAMLASIDIDFTRSPLPLMLAQMEGGILDHYRNGIFYSNHMEKGDFLRDLLCNSGYIPASIILVDDKRDSLESVEAAMQELGIPFTGFWYTRTARDRKGFSPMIANIQLQVLIEEEKVISDEEAQTILETSYQDVDPDVFFRRMIYPWAKLMGGSF